MPKRIPPFRLDAHPLTPEAEAVAAFTWAALEVGTRHRIGGAPDGVPESEYPRCHSCGHAMTFYGQLDSIGDDVSLADVGVLHVFVCFDCFDAAARVASTYAGSGFASAALPLMPPSSSGFCFDQAVRERTTLWRPVGQAELDLIAATDWRRLEGQPIFYPVLNEEYATKIARDWNTKDPASGFAGYVLRFEVDAAYLSRFAPRRVGGRGIDELWVPAEQLDEFNAHIVGKIELVAEYR